MDKKPPHDLPNEPCSREVQTLFEALHRGDISQEQTARLEELIKSSEAAAAHYIQLVHQRASLRLLLGPPIQIGDEPFGNQAGSKEPAHATESSKSNRTLSDWEDPHLPQVKLGKITGEAVEKKVQPSSSLSRAVLGLTTWSRVGWSGIAVALLFSVIYFWPSHAPEVAENTGGPDSRLLRLSDDTITTLGVGEVRVESGTVRMKLPDVGHMVVDGPAHLVVETPMRIRLDLGRIKVRVTEDSGHGFVVVTPHGEIIDLGTEFGVDVSDADATELLVFEGAVDLRIPGTMDKPEVTERLSEGQALRFDRDGNYDRIMSVNINRVATFAHPREVSSSGAPQVISQVTDNLKANDTKQFYEIVHAGMGEDASAFVDRPYEWNGLTRSGMPSYLVGGDYVKTYNDTKRESYEIQVHLEQPSTLYLLWDVRVPPPDWLTRDFSLMRERIGLDAKRFPATSGSSRRLAVGAGLSVDYMYSIWGQEVSEPGAVTLGALGQDKKRMAMYGIVAVPDGGNSNEESR